ncbi:MAG: nucleotide sugar dehydrogenase [Pseudomonadota bacterium]|nr:nucleotide sugar dehydrogenase [Pseudomonadota bacterium]
MHQERIAVIGLGYVGLPLTVALARKFDTIGFDIDPRRIEELQQGTDRTNEVSAAELDSTRLELTADAAAIAGRTIYIATVPTPINDARRPDFTAILQACELIGRAIERGAIIVFESTVFPGATEEICGPALERASGLKCGVDFKLGYSPERINPGDKDHPLEKIIKIVAGQDEEVLKRLVAVYDAIIDAGIHAAPSIKVAEAAKVLENTQRDVNIALMNEISKICDLVGIRSADVLAAAGTKWNFLKFHPGLVGGHCIGVDPYYLTAKAEELGYHPEVILSGRRVNDSMGPYVARQLIKMLSDRDMPLGKLRVGVLGVTFKENVPDIRNSKVFDIINELKAYGISPMTHDPCASPQDVSRQAGLTLSDLEDFRDLHAVVLAVPHREYRNLGVDEFSRMLGPGGIFLDLRTAIDRHLLGNNVRYWSL